MSVALLPHWLPVLPELQQVSAACELCGVLTVLSVRNVCFGPCVGADVFLCHKKTCARSLTRSPCFTGFLYAVRSTELLDVQRLWLSGIVAQNMRAFFEQSSLLILLKSELTNSRIAKPGAHKHAPYAANKHKQRIVALARVHRGSSAAPVAHRACQGAPRSCWASSARSSHGPSQAADGLTVSISIRALSSRIVRSQFRPGTVPTSVTGTRQAGMHQMHLHQRSTSGSLRAARRNASEASIRPLMPVRVIEPNRADVPSLEALYNDQWLSHDETVALMASHMSLECDFDPEMVWPTFRPSSPPPPEPDAARQQQAQPQQPASAQSAATQPAQAAEPLTEQELRVLGELDRLEQLVRRVQAATTVQDKVRALHRRTHSAVQYPGRRRRAIACQCDWEDGGASVRVTCCVVRFAACSCPCS